MSEIGIHVILQFLIKQIKNQECPAIRLQLLETFIWPWAGVTMDFVVSFPCTIKGKGVICVVLDRLRKVARFTNMASDLPIVYMKEIVRLPGVPSCYRACSHRYVDEAHTNADKQLTILGTLSSVVRT